MTEESALDAPGVHCLRCEYDLRSLPREAHCPECGTPVEPSWRRAEAEAAGQPVPLQLSSAPWLRAMALACCVMTIAALLTAYDALRMVSGASGETLNIVNVIVALSGMAAKLVGLWLFGARQPLGAGSGEGRASRYLVRTVAVAVVALPLAIVAAANRFGGAWWVYQRAGIVFAVLAGAAAWVVMRRLAAAARRARRTWTARIATALAWLSPPVWVAHAALDPSISIGEHSQWHLIVHPVVGFAESVIVIPFMLVKHRWDPLLAWWVPEALISLASVLVMAVTARVFFAAAKHSPRSASRDDA